MLKFFIEKLWEKKIEIFFFLKKLHVKNYDDDVQQPFHLGGNISKHFKNYEKKMLTFFFLNYVKNYDVVQQPFHLNNK